MMCNDFWAVTREEDMCTEIEELRNKVDELGRQIENDKIYKEAMVGANNALRARVIELETRFLPEVEWEMPRVENSGATLEVHLQWCIEDD